MSSCPLASEAIWWREVDRLELNMEREGAMFGSSWFQNPPPFCLLCSFQRDLNANFHSSISGYFVSANACPMLHAGDAALDNSGKSPSRNVYSRGEIMTDVVQR